MTTTSNSNMRAGTSHALRRRWFCHTDHSLAKFFILLSLFIALLVKSNPSDAAEVRSGISSRETYVGIPVTIQIQFRNVSEHEPPQLPDIDGLKIEAAGTPSRSSRVMITNGRRSEEESITYAFAVTPQREGEFVIPSIFVDYDDEQELVSGFRLVAKKSETGDLMDVFMEGSASSVYVGEAVQLELNILVRPYRNEEYRITLSEGQMWQLISEHTEWGIFSDRMEEIAQNNQRPVGSEVTRDDAEGKPQRYYLYSIDATIYPQRPGTIDADECRIVMNYPTGIGRRRSPLAEMLENGAFPRSRFFDDAFSDFGSRLAIHSARPIAAEPSVEPIEVKPIPQEGRPEDYRGAVGRYRMIAQAKPTHAKVGDPITLHLVVAGDGRMDLVQAPPLVEIPALTDDFKVANQPLAGLVEGETKLFTTTIRARSTDVKEIPSIPYSYFDPQQEQFVTVSSDPIPITIDSAETMSLDKIVGYDRPQRPRTSQTEPDKQSIATAAVDELRPLHPFLVSQQPASPVRSLDRLIVTLPPLAILLFFVISRRERWTAWYTGLATADQQFRKRLGRADSPDKVRDAVLQWIARKTRTKPTTESAAIGMLRLAGHRDLAIGCEQLLDRCRRAESGVITDETLKVDRLKTDAEQLIRHWKEGERGGGYRRRSNARQRRRAFSAGIVLLAFAGTSTANPLGTAENFSTTLDIEQRRLLLEEAVELHQRALDNGETAPAESREQAGRAAEKYQAVIDGGLVNAALFINKAGAEYHAGRKGRAVADYRRALKLNPDDARALDALRHVENSLGLIDDEHKFSSLAPSTISAASIRLIRWIPATLVRWLAIAAWVAVWLVLGLRIGHWTFPWKSTAGAALLIAMVAGTIYMLHRYHWTRDNIAIVVQPELTLRAGDGESYAPLIERKDSEGIAVEILTSRSGWAKIKIDHETSGWVPTSSLAAISSKART